MATSMVRLCLAAALLTSSTLVVSVRDARADGIRNTFCLASVGAVSCTTQWQRAGGGQVFPWQIDARETAASADRERKWLARCRPTARQDQFGVSRYTYAATGCGFGKTED
jgi:hypothetical protein